MSRHKIASRTIHESFFRTRMLFGNTFNGFKEENPWVEHAPRDGYEAFRFDAARLRRLALGAGLALLAMTYLVFQGIPAPPETHDQPEAHYIGYAVGMCACPFGILVIGGTLLLLGRDVGD